MIYQKNMADVQNCHIITDGGDYVEHFTREGVGFKRSFSGKQWICTKCGDMITADTEKAHKNCLYVTMSDLDVATEITTLLDDDENNVILINEGLDDQCYLQLQ